MKPSTGPFSAQSLCDHTDLTPTKQALLRGGDGWAVSAVRVWAWGGWGFRASKGAMQALRQPCVCKDLAALWNSQSLISLDLSLSTYPGADATQTSFSQA